MHERSSLEEDVLSFIKKFSDRTFNEEVFNSLALRLFRFQRANNIFYRRLCGIAGVSAAQVRSWRDIPAMPTAAFKELILTSFTRRETVRVFRTSGTTLREKSGAHYFRSLRLYEASIVPAFAANLLPDHAALSYFFLMNPPTAAPGSSLSHMMGVVNRRFAGGKGRYYVRRGIPRFEELSRDLKKERGKVLLLSTAFALKGFLGYLKEKKIVFRLAAGSRIMETGGFKGRTKEISKKVLYQECGQRLGIPQKFCVSEYGMTELSSQYYARALGAFHGPPWIRAVVADPKTNKASPSSRAGVLRHVDLANLGSVIAVQSEDLGRVSGSGFEFQGRAPGSALRGCSLDYETLLRSGA